MKCEADGATLEASAALEDAHTRRARLEPTKADIGCAALRPGPFLRAARSFN